MAGHRWLWPIGALVGVLSAEAALIHLGRTYGSTDHERARRLPGDGIVAEPRVVTNHAVTVDAPREYVWPWLVQMGWGPGRLVHGALGRPDAVPGERAERRSDRPGASAPSDR